MADATDGSEWNNQTVGAIANDTTITNLQKFTKYALQVAGFTRRGTGVLSKAKIVTTDEDGMKLLVFNHYNFLLHNWSLNGQTSNNDNNDNIIAVRRRITMIAEITRSIRIKINAAKHI